MSTRAIVTLEPVDAASSAAERAAASSAAARRALARALELHGARDFELAFDARGAPFGSAGRRVSLAHTRELALAALASSRIGVDLERFDAPRLERLRERFAQSELSRFENPGRFELAALWTAKEAVLKLAGAGLAELSFACFERVESDGSWTLRHRGVARRVEHRVIGSHVAALCVEDSNVEVDWQLAPTATATP